MQAPKHPRKYLRVKREESGKSFTAIAQEIGHDVAVVSKAINHGRYPRVLTKIREVIRA